MIREEIIKNSPIRKLESLTGGGLKKGELGLITSAPGVGKTGYLVHIATDKMMQDRHVIHLSYARTTEHVIDWYEDIFSEIVNKRNLENSKNIHDEILHNRVIMNFSQKTMNVRNGLKSVKIMMENGLPRTDLLIINGYEISDRPDEDIRDFSDFARENGIAVWLGINDPKKEGTASLLDSSFSGVKDLFDLVLELKHEKDHMSLNLLKPHVELPLALDSKTFLISQE